MAQMRSPLALGTGNVWNLLLQYAIPSVIAMTAASLYNITDSIFIGHGVGALALSGLAITFPLMNLAIAFGTLVGIGASTLMSLRLGQKDYESANSILGNVFVLNIIIGLSYTMIILLFLDPILYFFGASEDTLPYAHDFMVIISLGNLITHMYFGLNAMLRATGNPEKAMYSTISTVIINIILAPLFIFVFGWGIRGAALATVLAQASMLTWQISFFSNRKNFIYLKKESFRLKRKIVTDSMSIGLAPFLMNAVGSIIVIVINQRLIRFGGDLAVGAYGIINRVAMLFAMIVMGLNQGMQPIAGYNFGAGLLDRVGRVLKLTIMVASGIMVVGFLICELFPHGVASVFTTDSELIDLVVPGLRIVMFFFPIVGFQMVTVNFFQSIGMPGKAIFMSLTRQVLFLLPGLIILPLFYGVNGVWYSMPLSDLLSSLISLYMLIVQYRKSVIKSV
ncbi:MAG TPA: MATE family efflux transporter [Bacteroidales bacterium]|nr:MATE family efflux transporter [Bacteroidales bacterium]HNR41489.1 MATE family efflux transporter [Bacteroidales bacterium]HPM17472.1 MATE family efflux transporter [Bacteroidales bacterium]HQG75934.1 MATE family efflux transporter [Bacteroidales bacterium]